MPRAYSLFTMSKECAPACYGLSGAKPLLFVFRTEVRNRNGGAGRDRTDDLLVANQPLSQLSYGPLQMSGIRCQVPNLTPDT